MSAASFNELFGLGSHAGNHVAQSRLVYAKFQETSGTWVIDSSGNGRTGTISGMGSNPVSVAGPTTWLPNAFRFDGSNDKVTFAFAADLAPRTTLAWVRTTSTQRGDIVSFSGGASSINYGRMSVNNNFPGQVIAADIRFQSADHAGAVVPDDTGVSDGVWRFVSSTFSVSSVEAFVNGTSVGIAAVIGSPAAADSIKTTIGCLSRSSDALFLNGDVAGVGDFGKILTAGELSEAENGPEPLNTVAPALHDDGTVTSGTWDSQSNGTITRLTALHLASDDSLVTSSSATNPDFSGSVTAGLSYYVVERASNNGGYDAAEDTASAVVEIVGGGGEEPTEGSGTASLTVSTTGEGFTDNRGQGDAALHASSQGEGWRVSSGNGQNALSVSVAGEGYYLPSGYGESSLTLATSGEGSSGAGGSGAVGCTVSDSGAGYRQSRGSGELPAIITTTGEGYATTGSYGETLLVASATGEGYVIRSGAGLAAMQVGTIGNGQSTEPATSGILAIQTIDGLYLIGF